MATAPLIAQSPTKEVSEPGRLEYEVLSQARLVVLEAPRPTGRPVQTLLGTLSTNGFRVIEPIPVALEFQEGTVVAFWPEIDEFGTGASASAAYEDLGHSLSELYRSLEADEARLGPDLVRVLGVLRRHLALRARFK